MCLDKDIGIGNPKPLDNHKQGGKIMAYCVGDSCISCGACEGQCPVGAITLGDGKADIDPDKCIDCGSCAGGCPVGAISEG